jgi:hypothetical protein
MYVLLVGMSNDTATTENNIVVLQKTKNILYNPYNPAIRLLGIHSNEQKARSQKRLLYIHVHHSQYTHWGINPNVHQ